MITVKLPGLRVLILRCGFCFHRHDRAESSIEIPLHFTGPPAGPAADWGAAAPEVELAAGKAAEALGWVYLAWRPPLSESFLLQEAAVSLINANESADEVYVLLIRKGTLTRRPS